MKMRFVIATAIAAMVSTAAALPAAAQGPAPVSANLVPSASHVVIPFGSSSAPASVTLNVAGPLDPVHVVALCANVGGEAWETSYTAPGSYTYPFSISAGQTDIFHAYYVLVAAGSPTDGIQLCGRGPVVAAVTISASHPLPSGAAELVGASSIALEATP